MDRYLYLKNANTEKMAEFLCDMISSLPVEDPGDTCMCCPATDYCHYGHNGMVDWLRESMPND